MFEQCKWMNSYQVHIMIYDHGYLFVKDTQSI
jgi:hypothetical protein